MSFGVPGVVHDDLLHRRVEDRALVPQTFVRAPLRARDDPRRGPVGLTRRASARRRADRSAPTPRSSRARYGAAAAAAPAPAAICNAARRDTPCEISRSDVRASEVNERTREPYRGRRRDMPHLRFVRMCYERPVPASARPAVAIDVTPLLGARSGIGNAVGEIVTALQALEAAPPLVPYTLSLRARTMRHRRAGRHALRAVAGAGAAAVVGALRRAAHRPVAAAGRGRARDQLPRAAESAADARERVRLFVRALPGAVHAGGARAGAARAAIDRARRDRAHRLGVRRGRDRGAVRPRPAQRGPTRRDPARRPPSRRRSAHAARSRRRDRRQSRSCSRSRRSNLARTSRTS